MANRLNMSVSEFKDFLSEMFRGGGSSADPFQTMQEWINEVSGSQQKARAEIMDDFMASWQTDANVYNSYQSSSASRTVNSLIGKDTSAGADRVLKNSAKTTTQVAPSATKPKAADTPADKAAGTTPKPSNTGNSGVNPTTSTPGDGTADLSSEEGMTHLIPKDGELWKVGGEYAVAYQTVDGGPWIYYMVPDDDALKTYFPAGTPKPRELTQKEADRLGAISPGSTHLLSRNLGEGWEDGFNVTMERESLLRPWLKDPEVQATYLAAALEGRTPSKADLESTEYFATRSDAEIQYVSFEAGATPDQLNQYQSQFKDSVRKQLVDAGVRSPDNTMVDFVATKWSSGQWTDAYAARQIVSLSNPYSSVTMDEELATMVEGMDLNTLKGQTEAIRGQVQKWLGPMHSKGYSEEWLEQWAGAIMDDPNAENDFRDFLQGQRMGLYPEYTNPNLTYEDIAGTWTGTMRQQWGVDPSNDKQWSVLDRVIRANDASAAGEILREEGMNLGIEQVQRDAMGGLASQVGDGVVRSF